MDVDAIPVRYREMYDRAVAGKSRRDAVRAHCMMCCGWQSKEVELCMAPDCPLFAYRFGAPEGAEDEPEATQTPEVVRLAV